MSEQVRTNWFFTEEELERAKRISEQVQQEYGEGINYMDILGINEKYVDYLLAGRSRNLFNLLKPDMFIAKPRKIKVEDNYVVAQYANGVKAYMALPGDVNERKRVYVKLMRAYHVVEQKKRGWVITNFIELVEDVESARELVNEYGWRKAAAFMIGINESALDLYWWRTLTFANRHIIEISVPGSGKTTFSMILTRFHNYAYFTEPPTLARLIYDSATMEYGELYSSNGLILDEFDKYASKDRQRFKELYGVLLTGMQQGLWVRGARRATPLSKNIPVILFGNVIVEKLIKGSAKEAVENMLNLQLKVDSKPLIERVSIVVLGESSELKFRDSYKADALLRPHVARGLARLFKDEVEARARSVDVPSNLSTRLAEHYRYVHAVKELLDAPADPLDIVENGYHV